MSTIAANPIADALDELETLLGLAGVVNVSRNPNTFFPNPVGVLIGAPTITSFGVQSVTCTVDLYIVTTSAPSNDMLDRLFPVVLTVLEVAKTAEATPTTWGGGPNVDPLPAYTLTATFTTTL